MNSSQKMELKFSLSLGTVRAAYIKENYFDFYDCPPPNKTTKLIIDSDRNSFVNIKFKGKTATVLLNVSNIYPAKVYETDFDSAVLNFFLINNSNTKLRKLIMGKN